MKNLSTLIGKVMIDDVVFVVSIQPPESVIEESESPFVWNGLRFTPFFRNGIVSSYSSNLRNLRLKINYDELFISGSLHKFYHGNNWGDFTWKEIQEVISQLSQIFGEGFLHSRITNFSFACNLKIDPIEYLSSLSSIKGRGPTEMLGGINHKAYGKYIKMADYRYKLYNKQLETLWHYDKKIELILRIEKEFRIKPASRRKTLPMHIFKPGDLLVPEFVESCIIHLEDMVKNMEFNQEIDFARISDPRDLECCVMMRDMEVRSFYKELLNPKTYRKKLKRYQELLQLSENKDLKGDLINQVREKLEDLSTP